MSTLGKRINRLDAMDKTIQLTDNLAHAGKRVVAADFAELLRLSGELEAQPAQASQMAELARRMVNVLQTLRPYYKKTGRYIRVLSKLQRRLETINAYEVLLHDLQDSVVDATVLRESYEKRLAKLVKRLHKKRFGKFARSFTKFLVKEDKKVVTVEGLAPTELRHIVPVLLHNAFAQVRAYETAVANAELQSARVLQRDLLTLRDLVVVFNSLLGSSTADFMEKLDRVSLVLQAAKQAQFAQDALRDHSDASDDLASWDAELSLFAARLQDVWASFTTRTTLRKFSDALLILR